LRRLELLGLQPDRPRLAVWRHVAFGFRFCSGCLFELADTVTGGTYTLKWNDPIFGGDARHYNRPGCTYAGGNKTYVQCRALIFP
jgi:hypothetical protein